MSTIFNPPVFPGNNYTSPFGDNSLFNVTNDFVNLNDSIDDKYTTNIVILKTGTEVFERYVSESEENTPKSKQILIFYENGGANSNNLFGTVCRVKMGKDRIELMKSLLKKKRVLSINGDGSEQSNIEGWAKRVSQHSQFVDYKILLSSVILELTTSGDDKDGFFKNLFNLNNVLADLMIDGVNGMEEWKFTSENYEFGTSGYKPIIPIRVSAVAGQKAQKIAASGLKKLNHLSENFDSIVLQSARVLATSTPGFADDIFIYAVGNYYEEILPDSIKGVIKKAKELLSQANDFISSIINKTTNDLAMMNAFLCGLINGVISLLQAILGILSLVVDNFTLAELELLTKEKRNEQQQKLEFIEDLLDTLLSKSKDIFNGLLSLALTLPGDLLVLATSLSKEFKKLTKYFWAFFIGGIVFEVLFELLLAYLTGGASAVRKLGTEFINSLKKITTATSNLASKSFKSINKTAKQVAKSTAELLAFIKSEIDLIIKAIEEKRFMLYIKDKIIKKIDDVNITENLRTKPAEFARIFPTLVKLGNKQIKKDFLQKLKQIEIEVNSTILIKKFEKDFLKKPRNFTKTTYLIKRKTLFVNIRKGDEAESIFKRYNGGFKPKGIKTSLNYRYPDNILNGTNREVKSGFIKLTENFKNQFEKDIELLQTEFLKLEWHIYDGIDNEAMEFIYKSADDKNLLDKINIILYE